MSPLDRASPCGCSRAAQGDTRVVAQRARGLLRGRAQSNSAPMIRLRRHRRDMRIDWLQSK